MGIGRQREAAESRSLVAEPEVADDPRQRDADVVRQPIARQLDRQAGRGVFAPGAGVRDARRIRETGGDADCVGKLVVAARECLPIVRARAFRFAGILQVGPPEIEVDVPRGNQARHR